MQTAAAAPPRANDSSINSNNDARRHRNKEAVRMKVTISESEGSAHREEIAARKDTCVHSFLDPTVASLKAV
jgi:hypothetical protein